MNQSCRVQPKRECQNRTFHFIITSSIDANTTNPLADATDGSFDAIVASGKMIVGYTVFAPIAFIGDIYVNLLKLIVIPLLMTQIITGVYRAVGKLAGRVAKTVILFVIMFAVSFCISAAAIALIGPGRGVELFGEAWDGDLAVTTLAGFFGSIVPSNIFAAMASGSIMPCILFAFAVGIAAAKLKAEKAMGVVDELGGIFSEILRYIMFITPLGVFCLIGSSAASYGAAVVGVCAEYIALAWALCAAVTVIVMILPVWLYAKVSPIRYLRHVSRIWLITLSTCSSAATLPNTVRVCNEDFGVPSGITDVVVPLGCTIHMCGGAVSFALLGLFTMQMAGITPDIGMFLYMLAVATLINMAAPGIPGGGIVIGATYLSILGVPTGFIGLYSGIYRVLDMAYTTVNVTGDITANILIAENERRKK